MNPSAHKFVNDIINDQAVGIAFAGHFDEMPISAIRAAQNFHRTEFLDNVEKAKTYANRAAESRKIADKAFEAMTKIIVHLAPSDLSEEERMVQRKYREVHRMYRAIENQGQPVEESAQRPVPIEVDEETEMHSPDQD